MAHFVAAGTLLSPVAFVAATVQAGVAAARNVVIAIEHRRAVRALRNCDPRMLKDIGLIQSDIEAALDAPLTVDPSRHLAKVAAGRSRFWR